MHAIYIYQLHPLTRHLPPPPPHTHHISAPPPHTPSTTSTSSHTPYISSTSSHAIYHLHPLTHTICQLHPLTPALPTVHDHLIVHGRRCTCYTFHTHSKSCTMNMCSVQTVDLVLIDAKQSELVQLGEFGNHPYHQCYNVHQ